jgi:hypothetical protein
MNSIDRSLLDKDGLGRTLGSEVVKLTSESVCHAGSACRPYTRTAFR